MKHCKLCGKSSNKVFIHNNPRLFPGHCTGCQDWMFMGMITFIIGLSIIISGLTDLIFDINQYNTGSTILWGIGITVFGFLFPSVVRLWNKEN